jgi:hypothetical protein
MGFFSWNCAECNESISNKHSERPQDSACVLITPNKTYHDNAYDGYGRFDGADVYELLGDGDRSKGLDIFYDESQDSPFKIKVVHERCFSAEKQYEDYKESENDPTQGFFYSD